jgi:hypothetical protein
MQSANSSARRLTNPRKTRPPALFHHVSASHAPAKFPAFKRRVAVLFPMPEIPTLYAVLANAASRFGGNHDRKASALK